MGNWDKFGQTINNSFYFVLDKIIDLMNFFISEAYAIGRIVLLIAILSAALNYALTGTGLKDNVIKILKATLFFLIVTAAYPAIIGWITSYTFDLAQKSVGSSVEKHFNAVTETVESSYSFVVPTGQLQYGDNMALDSHNKTEYKTFTNTYVTEIIRDNSKLFSNITEKRTHADPNMRYTVVAPAAVIKVILFIANECIGFADKKEGVLPEFSRVLKGLICAFFLIFTGAFALLEYVVCFLEFMLVASVGIILFPLSIWEGSKFLAEKFIGAIVGFFMKLLFCNISIFLLLYGFISLFYIIAGKQGDVAQGFTGEVDQITFIIFICLLFFFICKSAPGIAQSLLTGAPSLSAAGAIGAVAGAVGAVAATAGFVKNVGNSAKNVAGSIVGGVAKTAGTFAEAGAAAKAAGNDGGNRWNQAGAFMSNLGKNASQSLARSIYGGQSGGQTMGEMKAARQLAGVETGKQHMNNVRKKV
jgi:hypothetical protein